MKLSIIIPVYNEEKTIQETVKKVLKDKHDKEIIVVDDGSTDNSQLITHNLQQKLKLKNLKIILHYKNLGKGAAVRTGIKHATGDVLLIQDADLEYDPAYYDALLAPFVKNKAKVVYGSRLRTIKFKFSGSGKTPLPFHYLANRFLSQLTNILYGSSLTDMETGYKLLSREVYQKIKLKSRGFDIEPEMTAKILQAGYKIMEVPISTTPRDYADGKKITWKDGVVALWALVKYKFVN